MDKLHFDSDYMAGAHPRIMERLIATNLEKTTGYGTDPYTASAKKKILDACGLSDGDVYLLVGGTQTNSTVIDALLHHHEGVLSADSGHINVHEAGAIEATCHKVLTLPAYEGKVKASDVKEYIDTFYADESHEHMVAPGMLYISFPTELGTIYSLSELEEIKEVCNNAGIPLFIDGARLGYGLAASPDVTLKDIARIADIFYIGGTKVGALFGEAVVTRHTHLLKHFISLVKQHGALLAKGRLTGLQFDTLFTDGLYFEIGSHAVAMALKLKQAMLHAGYRTLVDSPTNQQFFVLPNKVIEHLRQYATFEPWGPAGETESAVRFVTDWATPPDQIDTLISHIPASF